MAQAVLEKLASFSARCTDFTPKDALTALKLIKSGVAADNDHDNVKASPIMTTLEGLLTASVSDEGEWSTAWFKLLRYVIANQALPQKLQMIDLDVPKQFGYMLQASITMSGVSVKLEAGGEAVAGDTSTSPEGSVSATASRASGDMRHLPM